MIYSQGVLLNFLVYYKIIKDIFGSDVGDANLASMLQVRKVLPRVHSTFIHCLWFSFCFQNFLICIEMFIAAVAHIYSFPHHPFHINSPQYWNNPNHSWCRAFLSMMDISDMQEDVTEHLGVVGSSITRRFQGRSTYQPLSRGPRRLSGESEYLIDKRQAGEQQQMMVGAGAGAGGSSSGSSTQAGNSRAKYGATTSRLIVPVNVGQLGTLNEHLTHSPSRFPIAGAVAAGVADSNNSNNYQQQQLHLPGSSQLQQATTRQRDPHQHLRERDQQHFVGGGGGGGGIGSNFLQARTGATSAAAPIPESNDDYALLLGAGR